MPLQATSGAATYDAFGGGVPVVPNYIEDVFSTWLYTGNGSTQTITNGIDLAGKGGLVWNKNRTTAGYDHVLFDTITSGTGASTKWLASNSTNSFSNFTGNLLASYNSNGFTFSGTGGGYANNTGEAAVSWTFRKQPKFFDVVTYTGNGGVQNIAHNLGSIPGCIIVKKTNGVGDWFTWHRSLVALLGNNAYIWLNNLSAAPVFPGVFGVPTATTFTVGADAATSGSGATYVAYLFAHNAGGFGLTGTDNVISCGSVTATGGNVEVNLGYEPQWVLVKNATTSENWRLLDNMRGISASNTPWLFPNTSGAEQTPRTNWNSLTATGFNLLGWGSSGDNYIYIAIRRGPMKTPTSGTSVFAVANQIHFGSPTVITAGFPVDLLWNRQSNVVDDWYVIDRLRGNSPFLLTNSTAAEDTSGTYYSLTSNTTVTDSNHGGVNPLANYMFRRAPGFFDEVCYTGTGTNTAFNHNLGVTPEMMITKIRDSAIPNWGVWHNALSPSSAMLFLNTTGTQGNGYVDTVTSTTFSFATANGVVNTSPKLYVAYLFASCPGVSKVGSYTGTGALQTINCGFTGGARFVLIKRTDSTGDWWVYDSARGITGGNDPYLFLNSTAAEVTTTNYVDTDTTGFKVTAAAPAGLNANGGNYIFLAIA